MQTNYFKYLMAALLILLGVLTARFGARWWAQRRWFDLQAQQLATIARLGDFPPPDWDRVVWKNALVTLYNVWGNVTFRPDYSNISNDQMRLLQRHLDQIVAETTPENSIESVERVFQVLLQFGQQTDFISGYREEFRSYRREEPRSASGTTRAAAETQVRREPSAGTHHEPVRSAAGEDGGV